MLADMQRETTGGEIFLLASEPLHMLFRLPVILFHTPRPLPFFIVYYVLLPLCSPCQAQGCQ